MPRLVVVVPGRLDTRTGGYIYDRRMVDALRRRGWQVDVLELDDTFPIPTPAAREHASRALAGIPAGTCVLVDSLALGAIPELVERESSRLRLAAIVHLPLAATPGLDAARVTSFEEGERRALAAVGMIVVTGNAAVPLLARYAVPPERIVVIEPGTDRPRTDVESGPSGTNGRRALERPVEMLAVAAVVPGKGHEILLEALSTIPHDWHLVCAGSLSRHPPTTDAVRGAVERLRLRDRVLLADDLDHDALSASYQRADLFVLASERETYGMAVAEALAYGLPVVSTRTGAIPDLVGEDAGVLVQPGDVRALSGALARVLGDAALRARLAGAARRAGERLPTWEQASARMAAVLESYARDE